MKAGAALWNVLTVVFLLLALAAVACTAAFFVNPGGALSAWAVPPAENVELLPTPDVSLFAPTAGAARATFPPEWTETSTPSPSPTPTRTPTVTRRPTDTRPPALTASRGTPAGTATRAATFTRTPGATSTVVPPTLTLRPGGYPGQTLTPPVGQPPTALPYP